MLNVSVKEFWKFDAWQKLCGLVLSTTLYIMGTPCYSDRLCSDRRYSDSPQSGRRVADFSWIGLRAVPIGKMRNQIPKIRGLFEPHIGSGISKVWYESLKSQTQYPWGSKCLGASINAVHSMHATPRPRQCFSNFYCFYICLSVLKMYWVVVTADCRNSVCRNGTVPLVRRSAIPKVHYSKSPMCTGV